MKDLRKDDDFNFRLSKADRRRLNRAARMVSDQRGVLISAGTLTHELVMAGVNRILTEADAPTDQQAVAG